MFCIMKNLDYAVVLLIIFLIFLIILIGYAVVVQGRGLLIRISWFELHLPRGQTQNKGNTLEL